MLTSTRLFILAGMVMALQACSKDNDINDNGPQPGTGAPVETVNPNTGYAPAFPGQTRVNSVTTTTPYNFTVLTSALASPWGMTVLPDGRLLITEKEGSMKIVTTTGSVGNAITGIPAVNSTDQGGLLGVTIDREFDINRMIYWVFAENAAGGTLTAVAKGKLSADETKIEDATVIYSAGPAANSTLHYGGRILMDATDNLVVTTGERSILATRPLAQDVKTSLGKIIRINKNGGAAAGNPIFAGAGALPELYSIGHRNPQGIAFHPITGALWQSEHGPRGGDEINRAKPGYNYGWPVITYGIEYTGEPIGAPIQQKEGMEQPKYYWDPVISPSGMTFYKNNRVPEWENNLFVGALSGEHIARLVIHNEVVIGEERLLGGEGQRFRDITQGKDGALYAITDAGRLYKIDRQM
jgi:glucose/arabinose dehydrogenase